MTMLRPTPPPTGGRPSIHCGGTVLALLFGVPAALAVVAAALVGAAWPTLPDPVAVQWNGAEVSGTLPLVGAVLMNVAMVAGGGALFGAIALHALRSGQRMRAVRGMAGFGAGLATALGVLMTASILLQRGNATAEAAGDAPMVLAAVAAVLSGVVAAGLVALLLPRQPEPEPVDAATPPALQLSDGERAVWVGRVQAPAGLLALLTVPFVVMAPLPLLLDGPVLLGAVPLGLAALSLGFARWRVRVDRHGVTVLPAIGWPGWRIPAGSVMRARAVHVHPLGDFGGYGLRFGADGRRGLVLRAGTALEIERTDGRTVVVTVDGADEAAALLNGLRERG